jgi:hypothetical protein
MSVQICASQFWFRNWLFVGSWTWDFNVGNPALELFFSNQVLASVGILGLSVAAKPGNDGPGRRLSFAA